MRAAQRPCGQVSTEHGEHGNAGDVVVREGWMAYIRREEHLLLGHASRQYGLAEGERSGFERRVDHDLVHIVRRDRAPLALRDAEAPGLGPVRRAVGDE